MSSQAAIQHVLLWDGQCGFCGRVVDWVERTDDAARFHCVAFQQYEGEAMTPELEAACQRAVHVLTADGQTLRAGRACLFVLGRLGWGRTERVFERPWLLPLVEAVYWLVARNRMFFSRFLFTRGRVRPHSARP